MLHPQHGKMQMEIAVVGEEKAGEKTAYWLEMRMQAPDKGRVIVKSLVVFEGQKSDALRLIVQSEDELPMEFPVQMRRNMSNSTNPAAEDIRAIAEHVGTETITTPAGSFTCEHFRMKDGSGEAWVSQKVAPYGIVKMTSREGSMVLLKVLAGERSQIRGEPQKMAPMMPGFPQP
ncbi:MAG: hypothetical protein K6U09_11820 [Acidobacteriia bacterium]|nr:hypothetical protein [Terriglobia bacterium]